MTDDQKENYLVFTGYHGTDSAHFLSIFQRNFIPSMGDNHWLGEGIYFFLNGISDPILDAEKWAIAESYNKSSPKNPKYHEYNVLEVQIQFQKEKIWDLTGTEGLKQFNYLRDIVYEKVCKDEHRIMDSDIIRDAFEKYRFEGIKAQFYIQFEKERILGFFSRIPNTTVLAVKNSEPNIINKETLKVVKRGNIGRRNNEFRRIQKINR